MYYVYVLRCSDDTLYVGYSTDLRKRITAHKSKQVKSTCYRMPASIVFYECFASKVDAKSREVYLKSGAGREQLKHILKDTIKAGIV